MSRQGAKLGKGAARMKLNASVARALVVIACLTSMWGSAAAQTLGVRPARTFRVQTPDGLSVAAQEWGNPDGAEIVFIHGFSQSHLSWGRQVGSELAKTFRLITYDIRGHGGSDKPLDGIYYRDHRRWAGELHAVIEAAKLKKPVLVGWSYGGRIVAEYLMEYGDQRIAGINFVSAFLKVDEKTRGPATPAVWKMASEDIAENIENTIAFLKFCTAKPLPAEELQTMLAYSMMVPAQVRGYMLKRPEPYEDALKKITVPVLVSHGAADRVALPAVAEYTMGMIRHARLSLYDGVGHMPFREDIPRFNHELVEFVRRANQR
jgi:pimeloyl-ACP methyl ester carboxylesterase